PGESRSHQRDQLHAFGLRPRPGPATILGATSASEKNMTRDTMGRMSTVDPQLDRARRLAGLSTPRRSEPDSTSPFWEFDREVWGTITKSTPLPLRRRVIDRLRGLGDRINLDEVAQVSLPLSRLLNFSASARRSKHDMTRQFFSPLHDGGLE